MDDEPDVLETTKVLLEMDGFRVRALAHHADVLPALVETPRVDVLLQDVQMPGLDLKALLAEARALRPDLKVILFSAASDAAQVKQQVGAHDLVTKPFDVRRLARTIHRWHRIRTLV